MFEKRGRVNRSKRTFEDFYRDENGLIVYTEKYHLKRGYCCHSNCKHCPYKSNKG